MKKHALEILKLQDILRCAEAKINVAKKNLGQMFSSSQVEHIFSEKHTGIWSDNDINRALTLKSLSHKT